MDYTEFLRNTSECQALAINETLQESQGVNGNLTAGTIAGFLVLIGVIAAVLAKLFTFTRSMINETVCICYVYRLISILILMLNTILKFSK